MHQYVTEYPPAAANAIETVIILEQLEKIFLQLQHTREFFFRQKRTIFMDCLKEKFNLQNDYFIQFYSHAVYPYLYDMKKA